MVANKYTANAAHDSCSDTDELNEHDFVNLPPHKEQRESTVGQPNLQDESFETITEVIVEETETEMDESAYNKARCAPNSIKDYTRVVQVGTRESLYEKKVPLDFENRILKSSNNRKKKMVSIEQAMTYKYTPNKTSVTSSTIKRPKFYPKKYNNPSEIDQIVDKMKTLSKERKTSASKKRLDILMRKSGSSDAILTSSLKQQLSHKFLHSRSSSKNNRNRSSSSSRKFKMSDFKSEIGMTSNLN